MLRHRTHCTLVLLVILLLAVNRAVAQKELVVGRDGRFVAYANGVVADTRTGLEWFAGPDRDTSYYQAVRWVRKLTAAGGGWRMPADSELNTLFRNPGVFSTITPLLKNTGSHVWPYQANEDLSLYLFRYMDPYGTRTFAVRTAAGDF